MAPDDSGGLTSSDPDVAALEGTPIPGTDFTPGSNPISGFFGQALLFGDTIVDSLFGTNYASTFFANNDPAQQAMGGSGNSNLLENDVTAENSTPFFSSVSSLFDPSGALGNWAYAIWAIAILLVLLLLAYIVRAFK